MVNDDDKKASSRIIIKELTPKLLEDYLRFFDGDAFKDNPEWAGCYCMYMHFLGTNNEWNARSSSANRSDIIELINQNKANGLLAYLGGQVVGWCHATPRTNLKKLDVITGFQVNDKERIGSIVCFVVAAPYRRRGIARSLLDSACNIFQKWGLSIAEAYPNTKAETDAENWGGPLSLYLSAGFKLFRKFKNRMIVRKLL